MNSLIEQPVWPSVSLVVTSNLFCLYCMLVISAVDKIERKFGKNVGNLYRMCRFNISSNCSFDLEAWVR